MVAEIYPLEKVVLNGISIELGMPQAAVEARLGKVDAVRNCRYCCNSDLAIHYTQDGTVEFIEFLGGPDGSLKPILYEVSAFDVPAEALVNLLREKNGGDMVDTEHGYSYAFPNISVGTYRERRPSDVQELIAEMEQTASPPRATKMWQQNCGGRTTGPVLALASPATTAKKL